MSVRAKFRCASVESFGGTASQRTYRFSAVTDDTVPVNASTRRPA